MSKNAMPVYTWKFPHMIRGIATWLPLIHTWRLRHATTGGTDSAFYCYRVWLRHFNALRSFNFRIEEARVCELGPGDTVGTGLAALISGASHYVGLDAAPFSAKADLDKMLVEIARMYDQKDPVSGISLAQLANVKDLTERVEYIRKDLRKGVDQGELLRYLAPWDSSKVARLSLNLVFSEGTLNCVDRLKETYQAMFDWLEPGGFASHAIAFTSYLSPMWNGHWAYSDLEWKAVRGRRKFLINREPLSTHLRYAQETGFQLLSVDRVYDDSGLKIDALSKRARTFDEEDLRTRRASVILRKPS